MCVVFAVNNAVLLHYLHLICIPHFTALSVCDVIAELRLTAVTWFDGSTNQRHSAFSILHFTFRIAQFRILPTTYIRHIYFTVLRLNTPCY